LAVLLEDKSTTFEIYFKKLILDPINSIWSIFKYFNT